MANINPPILAFFALIIPLLSSGQSTPVRYEVEAQAIGTTNKVVPFWMRSNQYGSVPLAGVSGSFIGRAYKDYTDPGPYTPASKLVDWAAGFQGRANLGSGSNLQLIEAYAKLRIGMFQLQAGRTRDVMGLNGDTTLSSGNFAVSGNALGIPKVEISIPEYWTIPWWDGLFAVKGNFAHGWVGRSPILDSLGESPNKWAVADNTPRTFFHQKSLYGRLGRADWKLKLHGGFSHHAYWGNEREALGDHYELNDFQSFFYVLFGKAYGNANIARSKIGNQLGSIDLGFEYGFSRVKLLGYRQNFYDVGALSKLANIKDGLHGLVLENKNHLPSEGFKWKKILIEFFYSKDQAGYPWSTPTASGDEDYYNNYFYKEGWSYKQLGLGNPLIVSRLTARGGQVSDPFDFFLSNRVIAFHAGFKGGIKHWTLTSKFSYATHYGTFGTSIYGKSTGSVFLQPFGLFTKVNQFSSFLKLGRALPNSIDVGCSFAFDQRGLFDKSIGGLITINKRF